MRKPDMWDKLIARFFLSDQEIQDVKTECQQGIAAEHLGVYGEEGKEESIAYLEAQIALADKELERRRR